MKIITPQFSSVIRSLLPLLIIVFVNSATQAQSTTADVSLKNSEKIIINVDAAAISAWPNWKGDIDLMSRERIITTLKNYVDEYAFSQVTSILYNVNFQRAAFASRIMTPYWDLPPGVQQTSWAVNHVKMHNKGVDPYQVCIDQTRKRKISPWISVRMNDHHYWDDSTKLNSFTMQHPELRLYPQAFMNYAKKEVRDFYLSFLDEVLDTYDMDGIELDWVRNQTLFKDGTKAEWISIINDFMKETRALVNRKAAKRGHPIKIAARLLCTPEISESYGLDGVAWVQNGWTDILIPSNWHTPTNYNIPVDEWKQRIGSGYNYILAPCADMAYQCQKDPYSKQINNDLQTMRAFAINGWSRGADAIYLFNHFNKLDYNRKDILPSGKVKPRNDKRAVLKEIGSVNTIQKKPRRHPLTFPDPVAKNQKVPIPLPVTLTSVEKSFSIYTGPYENNGSYSILAGLENLEGFQEAELEISVNGMKANTSKDLPRDPKYIYTKTKKWEFVKNVSECAARMIQFSVNKEVFHEGNNTITVSSKSIKPQQLIWLEVMIN